jgi:hypothetical protein
VLTLWSGTGDRVGMPVSTGTVTHRPTTECEAAVQATTGGGAKNTNLPPEHGWTGRGELTN